MKLFDNFKSIERFRRHVENDGFMISQTYAEYGTVIDNIINILLVLIYNLQFFNLFTPL